MEFEEPYDNFAFQIFHHCLLQVINVISGLQEYFHFQHRSVWSMFQDSVKERKFVSDTMTFTLLDVAATVVALYVYATIEKIHFAHDKIILELILLIYYLFRRISSLLLEYLLYLKENDKPLHSGCFLNNFHTFLSCFGPLLVIIIPFVVVLFL